MINHKVVIDKEKCILCGNCIEVCGSKSLEIIDKKVVLVTPSSCNMCGHCAAICPTDTITAGSESSLPFKIVNFEKDFTEIEELLTNKRSVREFKDKEIEKNVLEKLIHYAEKSPSSSNKRKREYIVVTDKNKILELENSVLQKFNSLKKIVNPVLTGGVKIFNKKMAKNLEGVREDVDRMNRFYAKKDYPIFRGAPALVFILAPTKEVQALDDCVIAQQYMMLYGQSIGLGSCVIGYAQYAHKSVEKVLNVKKGYSIFAVSTFGYPKYKYKKEIQFTNTPDVRWL